MEPKNRRSSSRQAGFTLVEIMVGLAIGMLATVVIIQVISVFEAQRRTTTGTADAQTNGGIALYNIVRELQTAGYPLMPVTNSALECTTLAVNGVADATATNFIHVSPVTITDNVAGAGVNASPSDTITIRYGSSAMGGVPTQITAVVGSVGTVGTSLGCATGDITLIANGPACAMSSATAVDAAAKTVTLANAPAAGDVGANLACMGTWNEVIFAVNNGNLERNGVPTVAGVVNLQAQYGISAAANSNQVIQWVNASGATWAAPTVANRNRIKAVRIAVVARNAKIEPTAVTAACSSTTTAAPTGLCAWDATSALPSPVVAPFVASPAPAIDLSAGDADWLRYRYRVFETIIPLRNMIWSRETL